MTADRAVPSWIKIKDSAAEMREDREVEESLEIGAGDEAPEQTGKRDFHFARLSKWRFENEWRSGARRSQQRV